MENSLSFEYVGGLLLVSINTVIGYSTKKSGKFKRRDGGVPKEAMPSLFEFRINRLYKKIGSCEDIVRRQELEKDLKKIEKNYRAFKYKDKFLEKESKLEEITSEEPQEEVVFEEPVPLYKMLQGKFKEKDNILTEARRDLIIGCTKESFDIPKDQESEIAIKGIYRTETYKTENGRKVVVYTRI